MKRILIINGIGLVLLVLLGISYIMFGCPKFFIIFFIGWLFYMAFMNYQMLVADNDKLKSLQSVDTHHLFTNEIACLTRAIQSVEFYRPIFEKYEIGSSIRDTYELLSMNAYSNVDKSIKWIAHYDYISKPSHEYIHKLVDNSKLVVDKLNELDELVIKVDDTAENVDMQYVDDMLSSLKEVLKDEEE